MEKKKQSNVKKELEHLHKTRKNDVKVCIYQEFEYGIEFWVYLDEYEREEVQKDLENSGILEKEIILKQEYKKDGQRIISLQID